MAYQIDFDEGGKTLHMTLTGHWDSATLQQFVADMITKHAEIQRSTDYYGILSDSTEFAVQAPEIAEGFDRIMVYAADVHRGPTAVVVQTTLNKLQAQRVMRQGDVRVFLDKAEAKAWLTERMNAPRAS